MTNPPAPATDTSPSSRVLRSRGLGSLNPGAPDLPRPRRTRAEISAEKERKEAKKEASATKTNVAKARVSGLREVLHQEQVDTDLHGPKSTSKKGGTGRGRTKKNPKSTAPKPKDVSPPPTEAIESAVDETTVSTEYLGIYIRYSPIYL